MKSEMFFLSINRNFLRGCVSGKNDNYNNTCFCFKNYAK